MGERLVGFGHAVHIVALLHGRAAALRCIHELGGKPLDHGLLATLTRVVGEPTHRQRDAAVLANLDRNLVSRTADAAALYFDLRLAGVERLTEGIEGVGL